MTTFDLGGHAQARRIWKQYFPAVNAIVFVVDATARERFPEARAELMGLLDDETIAQCPICILGNKIDSPNAASEEELVEALGVRYFLTGKQTEKGMCDGRPMELFMCSIMHKTGFGDGFRWIAKYL